MMNKDGSTKITDFVTSRAGLFSARAWPYSKVALSITFPNMLNRSNGVFPNRIFFC